MVVNNKKNFVFKENYLYKKYYTLSELMEIKLSVELTIEKYKRNNLNDEIINHLNAENSKNNETIYKKPKKSKQGLYLISHGKEFLKIGITKDIERRFKEINSTNPSQTKVLFFIKDVYLLEKILHLKFDQYRFDSEWFYYKDIIIGAFKIIERNRELLSNIDCKDMLKDKIDNLISL